jgi:RNA ligase (TIGR02306 family)
MRKLVSLRTVADIQPIEGADRIEKVIVDGWALVAQKGIHEVGKEVLYFEIDSFLPESDLRFESFMPFGIRTLNGIRGHRVKTKKLRGVYSQGVLMPISEFPEIENPEFDVDYSEIIGVVKYERDEVTGNSGNARGNFPSDIPKSDQERIQNLYGKIKGITEKYVGTLKMDGSSITVYYRRDKDGENHELGLCSRKIELDISNDIASAGKFEQGAFNSGLFDKVKALSDSMGYSLAIQGELVGPGIQGNFEKFDTYKVFAYNIFVMDEGRFMNFGEFQSACLTADIETVPVIYEECEVLTKPLSEILTMAEGKSINNSYREGIVWKQVDGTRQFKAISNKYLAKEAD